MNEIEILYLLAALVPIFLLGALFFMEYKSVKRKRAKEQQKQSEQPPEVVTKAAEEPVEVVQQPESPKVAVLRSAARQSLQINLLALEAEKQMAEIARLHRTDTTTRRNPQSDPCYRQVEWPQNGDDWRQDRF